MKVLLATLILLFGLLAGAVRSQTPGPIGGETQINTYTSGHQGYPSVAANSNGNLVVVWNSSGSFGTDTSHNSIQGQRLNAAGRFNGNQFQVNTYTTSFQGFPVVGVSADGSFVVAWQSNGSYGADTSLYSVQAQRYDPVGTPIGAELQANSYTTGKQWFPSVAIQPSGDFVVVWESYGSDGADTSYQSIQCQRFDAAGLRNGGEFQVNTFTTWYQRFPSVAMATGGDFVVVWENSAPYGTDDSFSSVQGQRFDKKGAPLGNEFQINTYSTSYQLSPSISIRDDGSFTVVWTSSGSFGTDSYRHSVQGQLFDVLGASIGSQFQVNTYTTDYQGYNYYSHRSGPSVAVHSDRDFVVVWSSVGSYGTDDWSYSVQGQLFDLSGEPIGGEFQVNSYTPFSQGGDRVAVAQQARGDFVVVWDSFGSYDSDSSGDSLQARRFSKDYVFADGFESGDTRAWSGGIICLGCPDADFNFSVMGLSVQFLNASTGDPILNYSWNFGDGTSPSSEENPNHFYGNSMTYNVTLTVTNHLGIDTVEKPVTVAP